LVFHDGLPDFDFIKIQGNISNRLVALIG